MGGAATVRTGGLGRALTEVLRDARVDDEGQAALFGRPGGAAPGLDHRLARVLAVLAAAFPGDVVATRHVPVDTGPVVRVRSEEELAPDVAFRIGALFSCSGDEIVVLPLERLGSEAALAVWRLQGTLSDDERTVIETIAQLADR
ncbi:MAG TPA: hypothetical protein VM933_08820 [Acidimicrobiales bacterium]|nr:hypothetical protein [Acidimicrobiales bacterium]